MEVRRLLKSMVERNASDVHLKVGACPIFRINKLLVPQEGYGTLTADKISMVIDEIANENQKKEFRRANEIDYAYIAEGIARFRVNIFKQRGDTGIVMRRIKETIADFEELNLPETFKKIAMIDSGIILVTGASSSGKSTTLASIVDYINKRKNRHIMTIENPIEYIHKDRKSVINQREIGVDTESFHVALRHVIRQDPDIIVIGEMRDKESVSASVSAAETGHLVLSSFHAEDSAQAITRLLDFFPESEKDRVRKQLSSNLKAVTSQRLLRKTGAAAGEPALIPAVEILIVTPVVSKLIRDNKIKELYRALQTGEDGMRSFNMSLADIYRKKLATKEEVLSKSSNPEALKINLKGIYLDEDRGITG